MTPKNHDGTCMGCGYLEGHDASCSFAPIGPLDSNTTPMVKIATVLGVEKLRRCFCYSCYGGLDAECHYCKKAFVNNRSHCPSCGCPRKTLNPDYKG
jgi:hypothetical protein